MCLARKTVATVADAGGRSPDGGVESLPAPHHFRALVLDLLHQTARPLR